MPAYMTDTPAPCSVSCLIEDNTKLMLICVFIAIV